ncbi:protein TIFY 3-like [Rosa sericea]
MILNCRKHLSLKRGRLKNCEIIKGWSPVEKACLGFCLFLFCVKVSKQTQRERNRAAEKERRKKMAEKFELGDVKQPKEEAVEIEASTHDLPNRNKPSALDIPARAPAQLTIFYAGSVSVFDAVTAEKVRELLLAAAAAAADKVIDVKNSGNSCPPSPQIQTGSSSLQNSSTAPGSPVVQLYPDQKSSICKLQAEFPIARRHSLQRFLEKRRDRLGSKSPYPTPPATPVDDNAKTNLSNNASSGLGCFKQSAVAQEQIQPSSAA